MQRGLRHFAALAGGVLALGGALWAQKPKSPKETQAILAVQVAKSSDERIAAIENVLTKFADTEFKVVLLQMAVQAEEEKGDYAQTVFYSKRLLEADPKNAFALVNLAAETARHIRDNDLNKDEELSDVEKWANQGIEASKTMPKTRADVTDEQWANARKDFEAQGYEALGMAEMARKNYDKAVADYKLALTTGVSPEPATLVRLGQAYAVQGKLDDAIFTLDKAIAGSDSQPQIKSVAQTLKADIEKRRAAAAGAKPAAAPAAPPAGDSKQP